MAKESDLVLEDGTGVVDANTYSLIDPADTYHDLHGNTEWKAASKVERATALVAGTSYLDLRWSYVGRPTTPGDPDTVGQELCWPRLNVFGGNLIDTKFNEWADDEIPTWILEATYEYALAHVNVGRLLPDPIVIDTGDRRIKLKREKIGPLEEETRYSDSRSPSILKTYAQSDRIILQSGLAINTGGTRTIRA